MFAIGLTGGIGTGKTEVSAILRRLGAEVLNADDMAHQVYRRGAGPWREIVDEFGEEVLAADGEIDRPSSGRSFSGTKGPASSSTESSILPCARG